MGNCYGNSKLRVKQWRIVEMLIFFIYLADVHLSTYQKHTQKDCMLEDLVKNVKTDITSVFGLVLLSEMWFQAYERLFNLTNFSCTLENYKNCKINTLNKCTKLYFYAFIQFLFQKFCVSGQRVPFCLKNTSGLLFCQWLGYVPMGKIQVMTLMVFIQRLNYIF